MIAQNNPPGQGLPEKEPEKTAIPLSKLLEMAQEAARGNAEVEAKAKAYDELVARLHATGRHPDYEYETTETGRKSGADPSPPEGEGWIPNIYKGEDGWERFDHTEESYWMRLREDAKKDPIWPWDLKPITLPPVKRDQLLDMLRERVNPGYMPGEFLDPLKAATLNRPQFNSKPTYVADQQSLIRLAAVDPTGFFTYETNARPSPDDESFWVQMYHPSEDRVNLIKGAIYASLRLAQAHVIVDLKNGATMIRAYNAAGYPGSWVTWSVGDGYHLDPTDLHDQLTSL